MTGEIFRNSNGFGVSYRFAGMIYAGTAWPGAETKLLLCAYTVLQYASLFDFNATFD